MGRCQAALGGDSTQLGVTPGPASATSDTGAYVLLSGVLGKTSGNFFHAVSFDGRIKLIAWHG